MENLIVKNVVIVVMFSIKDKVGGHIISGIQLANILVENNIGVSFLTSKDLPLLSKLDPKVKIIADNTSSRGFTGLLFRGKRLVRLLISTKADLVITFDKVTCYHSVLPCTLLKRRLLPILPGGNGYDFHFSAPLKLKSIITFSEEIKLKLIQRWNFPVESIHVNASRFSFPPFTSKVHMIKNPARIVYITGMRYDKLSSFEFFLDEFKSLTDINIIVDVIGDGDSRHLFEKLAEEKGIKNIFFIGFKEVNDALLSKYDLVVTMGRGIIEGIGFGVPVAISGENGYKGIVDDNNFEKFSTTNFTGRNVVANGSLDQDLNRLYGNELCYLDGLNRKVREKYDVSNLHKEILNLYSNELVPYNGNLILAATNLIKTIINKKS